MDITLAVHHLDTLPDDNFSRKWIENLLKKGIRVKQVNLRLNSAIEQLRDCDGVMWHWYHLPDDKQSAPRILYAIEMGLRLPVFPNFVTCWHYDDKVAQSYLLSGLNVPKVKSWVFWNREEAFSFVQNAHFPLVLKLAVGAGAANVRLLANPREANEHIEQLFGKGTSPYTWNEFAPSRNDTSTERAAWLRKVFPKRFSRLDKEKRMQAEEGHQHWYYLIQKNYIFFQEFCPGNQYDIRITVIGSAAFAFIRHNREGDFRASGSGRIEYDQAMIPHEAIQIAFRVSEECGFQSMAYDFLYDANRNLVINELSYAYLNAAIFQCPGYWDKNLNFHSGHLWPEELHVQVFLNQISSRSTIVTGARTNA